YNPQMEAGFRRRRCGVFRAYLRGLRAEFRVARIELGTLRVQSPERLPATRVAGCALPQALCLGYDSGESVSVVPVGTGQIPPGTGGATPRRAVRRDAALCFGTFRTAPLIEKPRTAD